MEKTELKFHIPIKIVPPTRNILRKLYRKWCRFWERRPLLLEEEALASWPDSILSEGYLGDFLVPLVVRIDVLIRAGHPVHLKQVPTENKHEWIWEYSCDQGTSQESRMQMLLSVKDGYATLRIRQTACSVGQNTGAFPLRSIYSTPYIYNLRF